CGVWALKPTIGAFNRAEGLEFSQSHHGIHANSEIDLWHAATEIALRMGGDPGHPGLYCERGYMPAPRKPTRLAVLETEGWSRVEAYARKGFEAVLEKLQQQGVELVTRADSLEIEELEQAIASASEISLNITAWEHRWMMENLMENHPDKVGKYLMLHI